MWNKFLTRFVKRLAGVSFEDIKYLSKNKRARVADLLRKEVQLGDSKLAKQINRALNKDFYNLPLTNDERLLINLYSQATDSPVEDIEYAKIKSKSGNFIEAVYFKKTKQCVVKMKRGKNYYTFFKVPRTKWLALADIGGRYMWDWFGQHYSTNPNHWVRKSPLRHYDTLKPRKSTKNYTQTQRFKNKQKASRWD